MLAEGSYGTIPKTALPILRNIIDSSRYMATSIEDYLNISRIEAGNMKYEMSDFDLKELTENITDEMRQIGISKGIVVVFRSDSTGSSIIHADIGKVRQVIINLIDNSLKYTSKGTIVVMVQHGTTKKHIQVRIQDTGLGINQETLENIFNKFVRAKNANCVNTTGTGLGLYVAKKMVEQMRGRIWAESEGHNKGSIFYVEFPLV
jgi:signal transduction histidine kinase